ncbi:Uncharacterised protein [uncultured archaeon]|nr:Uncharacterised protein [uncultured archaeon]
MKYIHQEITSPEHLREAERLIIRGIIRDWSKKVTREGTRKWFKGKLSRVVKSGGKVFATFDSKGKIVACSYVNPIRNYYNKGSFTKPIREQINPKETVFFGGMAVDENHLRRGLSTEHEKMRMKWTKKNGFKLALTNTARDLKRFPGLIKTGWKVIHDHKNYWNDGTPKTWLAKRV